MVMYKVSDFTEVSPDIIDAVYCQNEVARNARRILELFPRANQDNRDCGSL